VIVQRSRSAGMTVRWIVTHGDHPSPPERTEEYRLFCHRHHSAPSVGVGSCRLACLRHWSPVPVPLRISPNVGVLHYGISFRGVYHARAPSSTDRLQRMSRFPDPLRVLLGLRMMGAANPIRILTSSQAGIECPRSRCTRKLAGEVRIIIDLTGRAQPPLRPSPRVVGLVSLQVPFKKKIFGNSRTAVSLPRTLPLCRESIERHKVLPAIPVTSS